jgi:predicted nucleotidyltransferase
MSALRPVSAPAAKSLPRVSLREIRAIAQIIAEKFDPDKIVLFGSRAYGRPYAGSDVDLLVVMDTLQDKSVAARSIRDALPPRSFSLDILVRSQAEIDRRIAQDDWFLEEITRQGKVLYARNHR